MTTRFKVAKSFTYRWYKGGMYSFYVVRISVFPTNNWIIDIIEFRISRDIHTNYELSLLLHVVNRESDPHHGPLLS